jgi:hypothetical protein
MLVVLSLIFRKERLYKLKQWLWQLLKYKHGIEFGKLKRWLRKRKLKKKDKNMLKRKNIKELKS